MRGFGSSLTVPSAMTKIPENLVVIMNRSGPFELLIECHSVVAILRIVHNSAPEFSGLVIRKFAAHQAISECCLA